MKTFGSEPRTLRMSAFVIVILLSALAPCAVGGQTDTSPSPAPTVSHEDGLSVLEKCKEDLARRLNLEAEQIELADAQEVSWPDASLGMPEPGKVYAQALTSGKRIILEARGHLYLYTTGAETIRYGGPLRTWVYSMLYVQPVENEPNLNGDLYQCSLIGTNSRRLTIGVADYYSQDRGVVVAKRRISRSRHDLFYINVDQPGDEKVLYRAFDFGHTVLDLSRDRWAGYVRPQVGEGWTVVIGSPSKGSSELRSLPLPEGTTPDKIAWSLDNLMILVKKGKGVVAFEANPQSDNPEWKPVNTYSFPGQNDFSLNKSESLDVEQVKVDGKPGVLVARIWFNGDRNLVARIPDFTMRGCSILGDYLFIWGDSSTHPVAHSVHIYTGVSVSSAPGKCENIKPFAYPPHDSPIPRAPRMD